MVRLKGEKKKQLQFGLVSFNSSVVRLKDEAKTPDIPALVEFQFQCGSIKRNLTKGNCFDILCFNSSVVRLKANSLDLKILGFILFQFQCGSIKRSGFL